VGSDGTAGLKNDGSRPRLCSRSAVLHSRDSGGASQRADRQLG